MRYGISADAQRARAAAQRSIRRRCSCGQVIVGNLAWWSHTHHRDRTEREGHMFWGRA